MADVVERPAYASGRPIAVGDRVWWDEGAAIGHVRELWACPDAWRSAGQREATLLIAQARDPAVPSDLVAYPLRALAEEGVDVLSAEEAAQVDAVLAAVARHLGAASGDDLGVSCTWESGRLRHWTVTRYADASRTTYRVPPELTPIVEVATGAR